MENLFSTTMYFIFGKRWIRHQMLHGLKTAVFVNEIEIEMHRSKHRLLQNQLDTKENQLRVLEETQEVLLAESNDIPKPAKGDKEAFDTYKEAKQKVQVRIDENKQQLESSKKDIEQTKQRLEGAHQEVEASQAMAVANRKKYKFVSRWSVSKHNRRYRMKDWNIADDI